MISHSICSEEMYQQSSFPIDDEALEAECKRRGVRMAFLTLATIFGAESVNLIKELHAAMTAPMQDSHGHTQDLEDKLFLRMTYWATQAEHNVELFSLAEQAAIERSAQEILGSYQALTQDRYDQWKKALLALSPEQKATGASLLN